MVAAAHLCAVSEECRYIKDVVVSETMYKMLPANFRCAVCVGTHVAPVESRRVSVGDESLECVDELCFLSDMVIAGGEAEASSVAGIWNGWQRFQELLVFLVVRGLCKT